MKMGLLHVYTGEGKGKTTAALGLSVRAAGAGRKVIFAQFMKGAPTAELESLKQLSKISVLRCHEAFPFYSQMTEEEKNRQTLCHNEMLGQIRKAVEEKQCDVLILDEVTYPLQWQLLDVELFKQLLGSCRGKTEVVCTGRNAPQWLWDQADYITEMKAVRHPYEKGIAARQGIEY